MEAVDTSITVVDDVDAAVNMDGVATSAHRGAAGTEETVDNSLDCVDNANGIETAKDEDATTIIRKCRNPTGVTIADSVDNVRDDVESADGSDSADLTDSGSMQINDLVDSMDQSVKDNGNGCERDGDNTNESTCLEAMTPYGQDHYLRLGDTPRRRSALRLSRIIARQQLLRRLAQGRNRELWQSYCRNFSVIRFVVGDLNLT